jgi:hypothetical protein
MGYPEEWYVLEKSMFSLSRSSVIIYISCTVMQSFIHTAFVSPELVLNGMCSNVNSKLHEVAIILILQR